MSVVNGSLQLGGAPDDSSFGFVIHSSARFDGNVFIPVGYTGAQSQFVTGAATGVVFPDGTKQSTTAPQAIYPITFPPGGYQGFTSLGPNVAFRIENSHLGGHMYQLLASANNSVFGPGKFVIQDSTVGGLARVTIDNAGNVGIGPTSPTQRLEVDGGLRLNTITAKPACTAGTQGTLWMTQGGSGVKDNLEVCAKDAADAYAWRTLY